jgi:hypothetical protein
VFHDLEEATGRIMVCLGTRKQDDWRTTGARRLARGFHVRP